MIFSLINAYRCCSFRKFCRCLFGRNSIVAQAMKPAFFALATLSLFPYLHEFSLAKLFVLNHSFLRQNKCHLFSIGIQEQGHNKAQTYLFESLALRLPIHTKQVRSAQAQTLTELIRACIIWNFSGFRDIRINSKRL